MAHRIAQKYTNAHFTDRMISTELETNGKTITTFISPTTQN